ncbi:hypothetical protein RJ45_19370 [Photobacterium gaetbulicola]|uniref:Nuclear transport factor 2 family protein n=2 Tax=Photobacterium TaxID=657 RepID=A0ABU3ZGW1_9GAMM|nr:MULTISPECIES: hypothetical protein [Photobacterium]KHT62080.1 hypothetical protein RJ45_19370 [Photobacterium gaetbulicola]MDV5169272.1 hypothetical protein [Photobacterium rosenbergii]
MNFQEMSEKEILDIANPIMDNLMEASTNIDYELHVRDFSKRMLKIVTRDHLNEICVKYQAEKGFFAEREFVAVFKRPDSAAIVWKQYYTKAAGEHVAEMVLVYEDGRYLVDHAMVF